MTQLTSPAPPTVQQSNDAEWKYTRDAGRFSRCSRRTNEVGSAWLAVSIGPLIEDRIRLTEDDRKPAKQLLLEANQH